MRRKLIVRTGGSLLLAAAAVFACSGDKAPPRGQVMVALQTDMSIPEGVNKIFLQVTVRGEVKHQAEYPVDPATGDAKLPATLAIVAGDEVAPPVQVLVVGLKGTEARTLSKVVTTIPRDRIATLHVPIQWLCEGTASQISQGSDAYTSTCPTDANGKETSCVAGQCLDINVPEPTLPTYSPPDVFGGGQGEGDLTGQCIDVVACFSGGMDVVPDANCRVTLPTPPNDLLNFAARLAPGGSGICDETDPAADCFIALDRSDKFGWHVLSSSDGSGGTGGSGPVITGGASGKAGGTGSGGDGSGEGGRGGSSSGGGGPPSAGGAATAGTFGAGGTFGSGGASSGGGGPPGGSAGKAAGGTSAGGSGGSGIGGSFGGPSGPTPPGPTPPYRPLAEPPRDGSTVVQLPPRVCEKIAMGQALGIRMSTTCPTKTERLPTCGPWSSVDGVKITGTGSTTDGGVIGGECPQFPADAAGISTDEFADRFFQTAAEMLAQLDELKTGTFGACANIVSTFGATPPTASMPPSEAQITAACDAARQAVASTLLEDSGSILITPGFCTAATDEQLECEATCTPTPPCENLTFEERCSELGGACNSACAGDCLGTRNVPVECNGQCEGVCTGQCLGNCTATTGANLPDGCDGWCAGTCTGQCEGTCSGSDTVCAETCSSDGLGTSICSEPLQEPTCGRALDADNCVDPACAALCGAHAELNQNCVLTYSEYYGPASDPYRTAVNQNFGPLHDSVLRAEALAFVYGGLAAGSATLFERIGDQSSYACVTSVLQLLTGAGSSLVSIMTDAQSVLFGMDLTPDAGTGGTCPPVGGDTACVACAKQYCCPQYDVCAQNVECQTDFNCMVGCLTGDGDPVTCDEICGGASPEASSLLLCASNYCPTDCGGGGSCPAPLELCTDGCTDTTSDAANCGVCDNACGPTQICTNSSCVDSGPPCPPTQPTPGTDCTGTTGDCFYPPSGQTCVCQAGMWQCF